MSGILIFFSFFTLCTLLGVFLHFGSFLAVPKTYSDLEKFSPYECGFDPFFDSRTKFNVKFYLVSILFIIFDLEITFLFPWVLSAFSFNGCSHYNFFSIIFFLALLSLGFFYEWQVGALDW